MSARDTDTSQALSNAPVDVGDAANSEPAVPDFPVVGLGASAGGLAAFEAFFSGMPVDADPGMAFVLVQHLAPDHKSLLTDLIRRYTRMDVFEVEDGMKVQPNCAYIIPPNFDMAFIRGALQLMEPVAPRGRRMQIDFFFRSLAMDRREKAICVVFSGTGSDGTLGVRAVKGEGGIVMVQNPESTEHDGMPRSAIATGLVDYVLSPAEMPAQIIAYVAQAFGKSSNPVGVSSLKADNALMKILVVLRSRTGHDFSQYKPSTVGRRIERRMAVHQIETLDEYLRYLQRTPAEVDELFRDMLIGVTSFFRDPEMFKVLEEKIIPKIFAAKASDDAVRVWSAGCATGEEAYSIAMLLTEHQQALKKNFKFQLFATDIDSRAIAAARAGIYPAGIAADVSPERLARFFVADADGGAFRIHKNIRDMLVFSEQNATKDPPFSRLDLIVCRNLLIYMGGDLQKKLVRLFHYALNPGGFLFLGASETAGESADLFAVLDRTSKIFQRKEDFYGARRAYAGAFPSPAREMGGAPQGKAPRKGAGRAKQSLRELTEQALLQRVAPPSALVDGGGNILYLHGRTGLFLEPAPGETGTSNILKMAREGLQHPLATALHKAATTKESVSCRGVSVRTNGDSTLVDLTVCPVAPRSSEGAQTALYLVLLEKAPSCETANPPDGERSAESSDGASAAGENSYEALRIAALQQELRAKEEYLQTANEELETSNEELRSSNEEMQSVNEELQSTNEELETSKEELQSVNEELSTVNEELQAKVADMSQANNDMNNLLAGSGIGTVFVDHDLRTLRFTPAATRIINLISSDVGRPVGHIVSNLKNYGELTEDIKTVLETLVSKEVEVCTKAGAWYSMRILPYRTLYNVIEGAVITFVDISDRKRAERALQEARDKLTEALAAMLHEPLLILDESLRVMSANSAFYTVFAAAPEDVLGRCVYEADNRQWEIPELRTLLDDVLQKNAVFKNFEIAHTLREAGRRDLRVNARRIGSETGQPDLILLAIEDVTERALPDRKREHAVRTPPNSSGEKV